MNDLKSDTSGKIFLLIPSGEQIAMVDEVEIYDPAKDDGKIIVVCEDGNK